jgi:hypothetical protein
MRRDYPRRTLRYSIRVRIDLTPRWLEHLLDPGNPFMPWVSIILLCAVLLHLVCVYWVYRDALARYNRGAPWALATALVPLGGWLFYLLYRSSPLVEFDREEAELFDESEHQWTDYDESRFKSRGLFTELGSIVREEAGGYSALIRNSRSAEQRRKLSPEERRDVALLRKQRRVDARKARAERSASVKQARRQRAVERREAQLVPGGRGLVRLSERRQRAVRKQLHLLDQLRELPREDPALEELIFEMKYAEALAQARDKLAVAQEMNDRQGIVTAEAYIVRLEKLLAP